MGDTLLRNINILASSSLGEWGILYRTLIKAAYLPHESVGGGDPPLILPLPLPLSRLPCPGLVEVAGIASADTRARDIASVGGAFCDARDGACLGPCVVALPPTPALPLLARGVIPRGLPFLLFSFRLRAPACFRLQ